MTDAAAEIARLRAALAAAETRAEAAERELAGAPGLVSAAEAAIQHLRLEIAKLRRAQYGNSSERRARLIDQMELQLEELEAAATEDAIAAGKAEKTSTVAAFERRHPARKPFPEHLPRERVVIEAPAACACCGSGRIAKLGEDVTETLEVIPRQWKVIQTVREKFTCRDCEKISQAPAPFHATPLNRLSERFAREGVELSLSTLADQVGACAAA
ncbi:IS66 family transposase zinc-finger binding domain-containing protein, partial [Mangrovicoccus sp. HB161399]|uniref:IS66 family transposase n=1 Tax=Mangrovicoccus sp. HB161399 TaxID=2720392 RepID=UPI0015528B22